MVKAISFFGNDLAGTQYRDSKEILGNMPQLYDKTMAFLKANLHNVQEEGASFNTLGKLEIAEEVLEEVVQIPCRRPQNWIPILWHGKRTGLISGLRSAGPDALKLKTLRKGADQ